MNVRQFVGMACAASLMGQSAQAAGTFTDINSAVAQVSADSTLLSHWITYQFRNAVAFNSTAGNIVPSQLKLLGFEVGVEGVVSGSKVDEDGFRQLGTQLVDTNAIKMYSRLPFPAILGHAKIGLPFGLDAGVRVGGLPSKSFDNDDTHFDMSNKIFGIDVRKKLIEEGMAKPFGLTLGLNYTHSKGHINVTTPYTATAANVVVGGQTYTPSFSATGEQRTDWKTDSVGAQLVMNKQILFMNPYIGASANHNSGTIHSSINNTGNLILTDPNGVNPTQQQSLTAGGSSMARPNLWDIRGLLGVEFSFLPFCKLGLGGEIANQNRLTGNIGLRFQFR